MLFAKWVYRISGIWSFICILPLFFLHDFIGDRNPPRLTHPEFYYGFLCVSFAWGLAFLTGSADPQRFRSIMPASIVEKAGYGVFALLLAARGLSPSSQTIFGVIDLTFCVLFFAAFVVAKRTNRHPAESDPSRWGEEQF
jgi:hypothetical protein